MLELRPLLVGDNGQERLFYGSTHAAYRIVGGTEAEFEVVALQSLLKYLLDPESEEAKQKTLYVT
jgi:hypothetical protein